MRILKEGKPQCKPKPIVFTCKNCGCVFEEESEKCKTKCESLISLRSVIVVSCYSCNCPNCGRTVYEP